MPVIKHCFQKINLLITLCLLIGTLSNKKCIVHWLENKEKGKEISLAHCSCKSDSSRILNRAWSLPGYLKLDPKISISIKIHLHKFIFRWKHTYHNSYVLTTIAVCVCCIIGIVLSMLNIIYYEVASVILSCFMLVSFYLSWDIIGIPQCISLRCTA